MPCPMFRSPSFLKWRWITVPLPERYLQSGFLLGFRALLTKLPDKYFGISQVLNYKYLWFDKFSVSLWCSMVAHKCRWFFFFFFFTFCFYLFNSMFRLYSTNFLILILLYTIISFFNKENLIKTKCFLLEKHYDLWVLFLKPTTMVIIFWRLLIF